MKRILLTVEYDGSAYAGWQRQINGLAVQQVLEEALSCACGHPVSVTGASVKISANGSFSTGYISGIYNIGGAPETVYADFAADREKEIGLDTLNPDHRKLDKSEQDLSAARKAYGYTPGSVVSGGSITIAASDINVNGLIQSGFNTYSAEISEADLSAAQSAAQRGA